MSRRKTSTRPACETAPPHIDKALEASACVRALYSMPTGSIPPPQQERRLPLATTKVGPGEKERAYVARSCGARHHQVARAATEVEQCLRRPSPRQVTTQVDPQRLEARLAHGTRRRLMRRSDATSTLAASRLPAIACVAGRGGGAVEGWGAAWVGGARCLREQLQQHQSRPGPVQRRLR